MQELPSCKERDFLEVEGNHSPNKEEIQHLIAQAPIRTSNISGFNNAFTAESLSV